MDIRKLPKNMILDSERKRFAESGRACFDFIYKNHLNRKQKILIPSYVGQTKTEGSGVFDPIRKNKLLFEFYEIDKKLQINLDDLKNKVIKGNYQALLIIHYFGFFQKNMRYISFLCKKYNLLLIEDFCHTLFRKNTKDYISSFKIFSIHKTLNTTDGGYLLSNNLDKYNSDTIINDSKISLETLAVFVNTNLFEIQNKRLLNYKYYCSGLKGINGISIIKPKLLRSEVPLNFPILVDKKLREKLYFFLLSKGIETCAMWYELVPEIPKDKFPISHEISNSIINFSVHHDIGKKEIDYSVKKVKEFFKCL